MKTMNETLNEKIAYWESKRSETQAKKNRHQYTKTNTPTEKQQKQQTQKFYEGELKKIREITDAIEHLCELERDF